MPPVNPVLPVDDEQLAVVTPLDAVEAKAGSKRRDRVKLDHAAPREEHADSATRPR